MKKLDLIKMLEFIPEEAEIVIAGYYCDIMGEYKFNSKLILTKTQAYKSKRGLIREISNYIGQEDILVDVWELE